MLLGFIGLEDIFLYWGFIWECIFNVCVSFLFICVSFWCFCGLLSLIALRRLKLGLFILGEFGVGYRDGSMEDVFW